MQAGIDALERFTRLVNRVFAIAARVIVLGIVLVVIREVFFRYVLNAPSIWAMDGSSFALVFVFFLALAPALESGHHVAVDLFDPLVPARLRRHQKIARAPAHRGVRAHPVLVSARHDGRGLPDR